MDNAITPIATTTSLSLLVHGVALAGLLLVYGQAITRDEGVGQGVEIQLISSVLVADQQQADVPARRESTRSETVAEQSPSTGLMHVAEKSFAETVLTVVDSSQKVSVEQSVNEKAIKEKTVELKVVEPTYIESSLIKDGSASIAQATNASRQQHAILELLHRRISDKKEYPYLARRQRREGVATVAFVLHPDGKIENAHLVSSSRAGVLDRAALSAVKHIEPFTVAGEYLKHSEEFQVDIEFELL